MLSLALVAPTPLWTSLCFCYLLPLLSHRRFFSSNRAVVRSIVKRLGGFTIKSVVDSSTTHVVCGDSRRTMNVLRGISYGCWLVSVDWVSTVNSYTAPEFTLLQLLGIENSYSALISQSEGQGEGGKPYPLKQYVDLKLIRSESDVSVSS